MHSHVSLLLQDLQDTLTRAEADDLPRSTLEAVRDQLIQDDLLFHKGKEVRASLACCLADLLRLCAPEPPFNEEQLQVRIHKVAGACTLPYSVPFAPSRPYSSSF